MANKKAEISDKEKEDVFWVTKFHMQGCKIRKTVLVR